MLGHVDSLDDTCCTHLWRFRVVVPRGITFYLFCVVSSCGRILWWGPTDWVVLIPATGESHSALTGMHASATLPYLIGPRRCRFSPIFASHTHSARVRRVFALHLSSAPSAHFSWPRQLFFASHTHSARSLASRGFFLARSLVRLRSCLGSQSTRKSWLLSRSLSRATALAPRLAINSQVVASFSPAPSCGCARASRGFFLARSLVRLRSRLGSQSTRKSWLLPRPLSRAAALAPRLASRMATLVLTVV